jgi:hypothetical protein
MHYHPYYCEENIWHLAKTLNRSGAVVLYVLNKKDYSKFYWQKTSLSATLPVFWDYHVLYSAPLKSGLRILDFDTRLPFSSSAKLYFNLTFNLEKETPDPNCLVRVISAAEYVKHFFSARSHMHTSAGVSLSPPPPWAPITEGDLFFSTLIDPENERVGKLMDLAAFCQFIDSYKSKT